ncbi:hypothetical protein ADK75_23050 [Streptomyces virginiae]|uniref:Uncharacterized protein n=1 Tax=Streptomyces virginiae TaxID=1961 RepID=A0A0L8MAV8_STRVG|nr:hypothetical protein ADK75_23050 [Streptomyces virginiae]
MPVAASEADRPGAFADQQIAFGPGLFPPGEVGELLADAVVLLDRLGIDRVHVAGHSSGTRVAPRTAPTALPDRDQGVGSGGPTIARSAARCPW